MQRIGNCVHLCIVLMLGLDSKLVGQAFQPEFAEPIMNLTVPVGRDATFRCLVQNLGGYRVGWVKADTKAIQAIHVHVITNNHRVGVSHNGQNIWNLHIKNVQEEDRGTYMCQINTDPMKSQTGNLNVVVPPDFIPEETSGDITVAEGESAKLSCKAKGIPQPKILWRREDNFDIVIRNKNGKNKVSIFEQDLLTMNKVSRSDMGVYLCIASNGVPPSISKRLMLRVHFPPVIQVPNQLVGAPQGTDVTLECFIESSPKAITFWVKENNEMLVSSEKFIVATSLISLFETQMSLTVRGLTPTDVGGYKCVAKNGLGEVDSIIRLYEIPGSTTKRTPTTQKPEKKPGGHHHDHASTTPLYIQNPLNSSESSNKRDYINEFIIYSTQDTFIPYNEKNQLHPIDKDKFTNQVRKIFESERTTDENDLQYSSSKRNLNIQLSTLLLSILGKILL